MSKRNREQLREGMENILALQHMNDKNKIEVPEGSDGQQPQWPDDGHAPKSNTDTESKDGTREPERTRIPLVR